MKNNTSYNTIAKTAGLMTSVSVISLVFSFVKESVFAYYFGANQVTDAYAVATQIPLTLFAIVSTAISTIVIPCYSREYYNNGPKAAEEYASNLTNVVSGVTIIMIIVCELFATPVLTAFAPGMNAESKILSVKIFRIVLPTILLTEIMHINTGILNVHKSFILPSLASNILNVAFITSVAILAGKVGIFAAVVGLLIGSALQFIYSVILRRRVMRYHMIINLKDKAMIRSFKMAIPIFIGIGASEINKLVDRMVSSFLHEGSISTLDYASKLSSAISTLMITGLSTAIYPEFSKNASQKDDEGMVNVFSFSLRLIFLIIIPIIFGGMVLSLEIIKIIYCRGKFSLDIVERTAPLFTCYLTCLLFTAVRQTISRVFYSYGDSKTPMKNSFIGIVANIILNFVLGYFMGAIGLALATTISAAIISVLLLFELKKRLVGVQYRPIIKLVVKIICASLVMATVIYLSKYILTAVGLYQFESLVNNILFVLGSLIVGITCYVVILAVLKVDEIKEFFKFVKGKFGR